MIRFMLKELLAARGWTVYRLSQESGVRQDVIAQYRDNLVKRAVLAHLTAFCASLQCGIGELMEFVPDKATKASKAAKKR